MTQQQQNNLILLPVGRYVQGDIYDLSDEDGDGNKRVYTDGDKKGQPKFQCFFAYAIAKNPGETHWAQTEWGAKIWAFGHSAWPNGQAQAPDFAWKIEDGDSAVPKKGGRPSNNTREEFRGCWLIKFTSGYLPKIYVDQSGRIVEAAPGIVKLGHFLEIAITYDSNKSTKNAGIYLNPSAVMYRGYGKEIVRGIDPNMLGMGRSALPPGASAIPHGSAMGALPAGASAPPAAPIPPPAAGTPPPPPVPAASAPPPPPATPVAPSAAFATPPPPPGGSVPPPPPQAAAGPQMTAKANGLSYAQMIAGGWTDTNLRAHGYMV